MSWNVRWTILLCAVASLTACLDRHELSLGSHEPMKDAAQTSTTDAGGEDVRENDDDDDADDDEAQTEVENDGDFDHEMR